jgi:nicotinamidase-related amidase
MLEKPVKDKLVSLNRKKVVLYGIEAHVCVKQTCFDLIESDFDVTLVIDAISSIGYHDRTIGIEAMRDAGAQITTF